MTTDPASTSKPAADRRRHIVHLWKINIALPDERVAELRILLSGDELKRADRFRFDKHRDRFIAGRGMLRTLLAGFCDAAPESLSFEYDANGKPSLSDRAANQPLHFNLSHSADVALLAVTSIGPVGIDVERIKPLRDLDAVVGQFFSASEQAVIRELGGADLRLDAFYDCWTRKEAYLKAIGCGIFQPTDTFDVAFGPGTQPAIVAIDNDPDAANAWLLHDLDVEPGYSGALAIRSTSPIELKWHDVPAH